jgi:hypothetical protein
MSRQFVIFKLGLALLISAVFCGSVFAQSDPWVHAEPTAVVPYQLAVFSCSGQTTVNSRWIFRDSGYRVTQTPVVTRAGNTISLDARVEEFNGGRAQVIVPFEKNFDIGTLEPGTYTLIVRSWGTALKQIEFTLVATPPAPQPLDAPCFFVTQHYRDFLSREPDGSGFAFWTNELMRCGLDAQVPRTETHQCQRSLLSSRSSPMRRATTFIACTARRSGVARHSPNSFPTRRRWAKAWSRPAMMRGLLDWAATKMLTPATSFNDRTFKLAMRPHQRAVHRQALRDRRHHAHHGGTRRVSEQPR